MPESIQSDRDRHRSSAHKKRYHDSYYRSSSRHRGKERSRSRSRAYESYRRSKIKTCSYSRDRESKSDYHQKLNTKMHHISESHSSKSPKSIKESKTSTNSNNYLNSRRPWKFDSPPKEDIVVNLNSSHPSSMGVIAQSLGLSCEQQKAARELYVGNLPPNLDVNQLIDFFNAAMLTLNSSAIPGKPVSRAWIAADGHFAFVEFRTIEEATIALQLNGLNCMGYTLRIGRPKTYPTEYSNLLSSTNTAFVQNEGLNATASTLTPPILPYSLPLIGRKSLSERCDRLVIIDIPISKTSSELHIRDLLEKYGKLKIFQYFEIPLSNDRESSGVCVFEYSDLGQQRFLENAISEKKVECTFDLKLMNAEEALHEGQLSEIIKKSGVLQNLGGDLVKPQVPTCVIMLTNIVTESEFQLVDDKEYMEILEDVTVECSQYGTVLGVQIPRPLGAYRFECLAIKNAFVKFSSIQEAGAARKALSGRKFAGRTVEAHYFSSKKFDDKDFRNAQPNFDEEN